MRRKHNPFTYAVIFWAAVLTVAVLITLVQNASAADASKPEIIVEMPVVLTVPETEPESEPEPEPAIYADFELTDYERGLLAMVVYREARGEPEEGRRAVVEVVLNRVRSPLFPNTIDGVVYQSNPVQFACAGALTTASVKELGALSVCFDTVDAVLAETEPTLNWDALYFSTRKPSSAEYMKIGSHYFH